MDYDHDGHQEHRLSGGAQTPGVVRVGSTVRRPRHDRSEFVQTVLRHLEVMGFTGAPRALGYDDRGREVVSYVAGTVPGTSPYLLTDVQLTSAAGLVRDFHDAVATSSLCGDQEVVCHGDLGPHNTVFADGAPIAIIDWDAQVAPGRRAVDFAHAVWCFADVTEADVPMARQARGIDLMCRAYPGMTPIVVIDELTARFVRAREQHLHGGRPAAAEIFDGLLGFIRAHRAELITGRATGYR